MVVVKINFTKKQYRQLLDLVYLGEWTANSSKVHGERNEEYDEIFQYVCSFSKSFGCEDLIEFDQSFGEYFPTKEYEESMHSYIEENDNEVFWNQISLRLAKRDIQKIGKKYRSKEEYLRHLFQLEEEYEIEFEKHGIERLVIREKELES